MGKRSPLDFYHQFLWKLENCLQKECMYVCTRCHTKIQTYKEVQQHCRDQDCEAVEEEIEWLN